MRRTIAIAVVTAAAVGLGCGEGLPVYSEIEDLRVVAIQAEPPLYLFDRGSTDLTFEALVVDPRGGSIDYTWELCPVESDRACRDFDEKLRAESDFRDELSDARALSVASGTAEPLSDSADLPIDPALRPYGVPPFVVPAALLATLDDYYQEVGFYGFGVGAWPSAVLTLRRGDEVLTTQKRIVVGIADPSLYNDEVERAFGYLFCRDDLSEEQTARCLPWEPALAGNANPIFRGIAWAQGDSALAELVELAPGDEIEVPAGASIRIRPLLDPASEEPYQVLRGDLSTQRIEIEDKVEEISVSWFCTHGELQDGLTWPNFTKTLDTVYTAPAEPPADFGRDILWLVARDQRGGVRWRSVEIVVTP